MDTCIVLVYCLCDDFLKWQHHRDDPQCLLTDAEIMTIGIVAALYYGGNQALSRTMLAEQGYIKHKISRSRLSRRLGRLRQQCLTLFQLLGAENKANNSENIYLVDSFPIAVCDNYRIDRCRLYPVKLHGKKKYRGYQASKRRYVYGIKLHLIVTKAGLPVEYLLAPASYNDTALLDQFDLDLPPGAWLIGDKAYNDYLVEDIMAQCDIFLLPLRRENSHRPHPDWLNYLLSTYRKQVETAGSQIERLLPKHIHATTPDGFEFKIMLFVLASAIERLYAHR